MIALIVAVALAQPVHVMSPKPALSQTERAQIDDIVTTTMRHEYLPGMSLAIARNGVILYARGYGFRDLSEGRLADAGTVYNIASMTKQFTAAAILLLQQDGKLSVDDKLSRFMPGYRYASQITLRQILNHTSGIPDYSIVNDVPHTATAQQFVDLIKNAPLDFPPGSRFEYSNTNYVILSIIVEQASGMTFGEFLARRIFEPLGMSATSVRSIPQDHPDGAVGYTYANGKVVAAPATPDDLGYGDGTVNSSVTDLVRWDAALDGGRVLNQASWRAMTTVPLSSGYGLRHGYGFGLDINTMFGRRYIYHQGLNTGFAGENATFPDDGLEIVALSNGDPFDEDLFMNRIVSIVEPPTNAQAAAAMAPEPGEDAAITSRVRALLDGMQHGVVNSDLVTEQYAKELTPAQAREMTSVAGVKGAIVRMIYRGRTYRDRRNLVYYDVYYADSVVAVDAAISANGSISLIELARED